MRRGLADEHGARRAQPRHGGGVTVGRTGVRVRARAVAGRLTGHVEDVLDRDWDAAQHAAVAAVLSASLTQRAS
jgi:hypothetical protein